VKDVARRACTPIALSLLCIGSFALDGEWKSDAHCATGDAQPGWLTFTDQAHRFCFQYPPLYRRHKPERNAFLRPGSKVLGFFANGRSKWLHSAITVIFSNEVFDLKRIVTYAPNGVTALEPVQVGSFTFYYWGPGGGGVEYPDVYFFDLHGNTLSLGFDGPYTERSKSPDQQTKQIERKVLASFRTF
jgi:hypothetical protein